MELREARKGLVQISDNIARLVGEVSKCARAAFFYHPLHVAGCGDATCLVDLTNLFLWVCSLQQELVGTDDAQLAQLDRARLVERQLRGGVAQLVGVYQAQQEASLACITQAQSALSMAQVSTSCIASAWRITLLLCEK